MSIVLQLKPEIAARAEERAAVEGLPVSAYLEIMLEQLLGELPKPAQRLTLIEFDQIMDEIADGSEDLPAPVLLTRAEIYAEHD